jgi:hypothetical protein
MSQNRKLACLFGTLLASAAFGAVRRRRTTIPITQRATIARPQRRRSLRPYRTATAYGPCALRIARRRTVHCGVDTRGGVRLVRQLSTAAACAAAPGAQTAAASG